MATIHNLQEPYSSSGTQARNHHHHLILLFLIKSGGFRLKFSITFHLHPVHFPVLAP